MTKRDRLVVMQSALRDATTLILRVKTMARAGELDTLPVEGGDETDDTAWRTGLVTRLDDADERINSVLCSLELAIHRNGS